MKKLMKVSSAVAIALGMGMSSAYAENSLRNGSFAINVPVNDTVMSGDSTIVNPITGQTTSAPLMINGKFMVSRDMAVLAGFGLGLWGGDADGNDIGFKGGVRKYMSTGDFAPFVGGSISYISYFDSDVTETQVMGEFGGEYFMSRQFSVEGAARFGYHNTEYDFGGGFTYEESKVGTFGAGVSVNFYF